MLNGGVLPWFESLAIVIEIDDTCALPPQTLDQIESQLKPNRLNRYSLIALGLTEESIERCNDGDPAWQSFASLKRSPKFSKKVDLNSLEGQNADWLTTISQEIRNLQDQRFHKWQLPNAVFFIRDSGFLNNVGSIDIAPGDPGPIENSLNLLTSQQEFRTIRLAVANLQGGSNVNSQVSLIGEKSSISSIRNAHIKMAFQGLDPTSELDLKVTFHGNLCKKDLSSPKSLTLWDRAINTTNSERVLSIYEIFEEYNQTSSPTIAFNQELCAGWHRLNFNFNHPDMPIPNSTIYFNIVRKKITIIFGQKTYIPNLDTSLAKQAYVAGTPPATFLSQQPYNCLIRIDGQGSCNSFWAAYYEERFSDYTASSACQFIVDEFTSKAAELASCLEESQTLILVEVTANDLDKLENDHSLENLTKTGINLLFIGNPKQSSAITMPGYQKWHQHLPNLKEVTPNIHTIDRTLELKFIVDSSPFMRITGQPIGLTQQENVIEQFFGSTNTFSSVSQTDTCSGITLTGATDPQQINNYLFSALEPQHLIIVPENKAFNLQIDGSSLPISRNVHAEVTGALSAQSTCAQFGCAAGSAMRKKFIEPSSILTRLELSEQNIIETNNPSRLRIIFALNHKQPQKIVNATFKTLKDTSTEELKTVNVDTLASPINATTEYLSRGGKVIVVPMTIDPTIDVGQINNYIDSFDEFNSLNFQNAFDQISGAEIGKNIFYTTSTLKVVGSQSDLQTSMNSVVTELKTLVNEIVIEELTNNLVFRLTTGRNIDVRTDCSYFFTPQGCSYREENSARTIFERYTLFNSPSDPFVQTLAVVNGSKDPNYDGILSSSKRVGLGQVAVLGYSPFSRDTWERDFQTVSFSTSHGTVDHCFSGVTDFPIIRSKRPLISIEGWGIQRILDAAYLSSTDLSPSILHSIVQRSEDYLDISVVQTSNNIDALTADNEMIRTPQLIETQISKDISVFRLRLDESKFPDNGVEEFSKMVKVTFGSIEVDVPIQLILPTENQNIGKELLLSLATLTNGGSLQSLDPRALATWQLGMFLFLVTILLLFSPFVQPWIVAQMMLRNFLKQNTLSQTRSKSKLSAEALLAEWGSNAGAADAIRGAGEPSGQRPYIPGDSVSTVKLGSLIPYTNLGKTYGLPQGRPISKIKRKDQSMQAVILLDDSPSINSPKSTRWPSKTEISSFLAQIIVGVVWANSGQVSIKPLNTQIDAKEIPKGGTLSEVDNLISNLYRDLNTKLQYSQLETVITQTSPSEILFLISDLYAMDIKYWLAFAEEIAVKGTELRIIFITTPDEELTIGLCKNISTGAIHDRSQWSTQDISIANDRRVLIFQDAFRKRGLKFAHISADSTEESILEALTSGQVIS